MLKKKVIRIEQNFSDRATVSSKHTALISYSFHEADLGQKGKKPFLNGKIKSDIVILRPEYRDILGL